MRDKAPDSEPETQSGEWTLSSMKSTLQAKKYGPGHGKPIGIAFINSTISSGLVTGTTGVPPVEMLFVIQRLEKNRKKTFTFTWFFHKKYKF